MEKNSPTEINIDNLSLFMLNNKVCRKCADPFNFVFFLPESPICLFVADNWINSANLPFSLLHVLHVSLSG